MHARWLKVLFQIILIGIAAFPALAFNSGSTGALGAFNPIANTIVELPEDGILNYTTVNIPSGVTVTFKKNAANTPVYMLATGNVTIAGTIDVSGLNANTVANGQGGPGGFDGGLGAYPVSCGGTGLGPGGGQTGTAGTLFYGCGGGGGGYGAGGSKGNGSSYCTAGVGGNSYSNISILPLIGGSGGGGGCGCSYSGGGTGGAGGGGGGAILVATSGTIDITGSITANGGNGGGGGLYCGKGGGGSGGAIKLMAHTISGNGTISATGGSGSSASGTYNGGNGGNGRIRIEANTLLRTAGSTPAFTYVDAPVYVFPPNTPVLKIVSIGGVTVPASPTGKYSTPDIVLPANITNPVEVGVEASNIPIDTTVKVTVVSQLGAPVSANTVLSGTMALSTGAADMNLSPAYVNVVTATATFTVQTAANQMPLYAEGELVAQIRVDSVMGGGSRVTYITESGKEVPGRM
jgi:hypothetical protein